MDVFGSFSFFGSFCAFAAGTIPSSAAPVSTESIKRIFVLQSQ
jgi:hypothetical protein